MAVCICFIGKASAQWVVSDPGNLAQGIINTTKQIVQTSTTAKNTLDGFMEAQKIFQQGKKYYDALKAVHDVVKGGVKVKKSIELVAEISEIYVRNFQNMLADPTLADEAVKKFNINIEPDFLMEIGRSAMEPKEAEAIIAAYKKLGYNNVAFSDYLNGKLSPSEVKNVREALLSSLKEAYPEKNKTDLLSRLNTMKLCSKDEYVAENIYSKALEDIYKNGKASEYLKE